MRARLAAMAASLSLCAGCSFGAPRENIGILPVFRTLDAAPVHKHIKHVIVIIQENRSFEDFFAGYPGADAPTYGYGKANGLRVKIPLHQITFQKSPNMGHMFADGIADWDGGQMDGFSKVPLNAAYAFVERTQVQPYWTIAHRYVLADHMFPTEFGPSWTGHITLVAGTDSLRRDLAVADFSSGAYNSCDSPPGTQTTTVNARRRVGFHSGPFPCFTQFNTMATTLDAAGVSWRYYVTKVAHAGIWSPFEAIKYVRRGVDWHTDLAAPQNRFFADVRNGDLANVSWITPTKADSDHPAGHSDRGPSWVSSIVNTIGKSPYWSSSAIVVVWDDWGGFYDNARPQQLDFRGLGVRVPCLIISPYARRGYVSHTRYEFGSILKFVEQAFALPRLGLAIDGYTDGRSNSLEDSFDFMQSPRRFEPIPAKYSVQDFILEPPSTEPVDDV